MNSNEESDAKMQAKKLAFEKDRHIAKRMIHYILFYLSVIIILSISSFLLDFIFYNIDYGSTKSMSYFPLQYSVYYIIIGYWISPFSLIYNYCINRMQPVTLINRILACVALLLFMCYLINTTFEFGYYIGKYRQTKNIISAIVSGISVELVREWVVQLRIKGHSNA